MSLARRVRGLVIVSLIMALDLQAQDTSAVRTVGDSVSVRFVDADIRGVIQVLGHYLPKPVLVGNLQPARVSQWRSRPRS